MATILDLCSLHCLMFYDFLEFLISENLGVETEINLFGGIVGDFF